MKKVNRLVKSVQNAQKRLGNASAKTILEDIAEDEDITDAEINAILDILGM